jgi:hypothetical protein
MDNFNLKRVKFKGHATFPVRYSWLTKGVRALSEDSKVFSREDKTQILGVGSVMTESINYWLKAFQLVEAGKEGPTITPIGMAVFGKNGADPYLEDQTTLWLLHWLLTTNSEFATTWYWFFNKFQKSSFNSKEVTSALKDFIRNLALSKSPSDGQVDSDISVLLRMYTPSKGQGRANMEDALDTPLGSLELITKGAAHRSYKIEYTSRIGLSDELIGYCVLSIINWKAVETDGKRRRSIPIEDLMYSKDKYPAIGTVFRLREQELIAALERLVTNYPDIFAINETSGIHQLALLDNEIEPIELIYKHYAGSMREIAA